MTGFELFSFGVFSGIIVSLLIILMCRIMGDENDEDDSRTKGEHIRCNNCNSDCSCDDRESVNVDMDNITIIETIEGLLTIRAILGLSSTEKLFINKAVNYICEKEGLN